MTPDKRATLLKAFLALLVCSLLVGGYITKEQWLPAFMGAVG